MMDDSSTLPVPALVAPGRVSTISQLADIPEEEIWLSKQKSARTRRAYRLDVQHFMRTLSIATPEELRQADHKAVIAWERFMREVEGAAFPRSRTGAPVRRRWRRADSHSFQAMPNAIASRWAKIVEFHGSGLRGCLSARQ
jgi:hypothetical protein